MASYNYKVVPFIAQVKGSQLASVINREIVDGWEFYQLGSISIQVSPGCIASLFGAKDAFTQLDQLIFRRPRG